ncbi:MAG: L-asparaginase [Cyanobacteria bacterium RYN_339]|nr:L-asparaginase [Cyanobacteria bacterium RYN_339]
MNPGAPLAVQWRGDEPESVHHGHLVAVDATGQVLFALGEPTERIYARSAVKPVQVLPLLLSGAAEAYGLPDACLAVAMASHSGEEAHRAAVRALLELAGLDEGQLQCGTHAPYHEPTATALLLRGEAPTPLYCNCSGKHAGMLAVCRHQGWDLAGYRDADHPLQCWIRELLAGLAEVPVADLGHAIDGCGVPVWRLPLIGLARAFSRLAGSADPVHQRVAKLMTEHPHLIAGTGRLDTDLMRAGGGRVFGKIGGEAVHAGGVRGTGIGWAIKVTDGNKRALGPALARLLEMVGHPVDLPTAVVYNNRREAVGRVAAAF